MTRYTPYFRIAISHSYYEPGQAVPITVTADADTSRFLTQFDCVTKTRADGLEVYSPQDRSDLAANGPQELIFALTAQTPQLPGLTTPEPPKIRGPGNTSFTPAPANSQPKHRIGNVQLQVTPDLSDGVFEIDFQAIALRWTYVVMGGDVPDSFQISGPDPYDPGTPKAVLEFDDLGETALANGKQARRFISPQPLRLTQHSPYRFELSMESRSGVSQKISPLPVAATNSGLSRVDQDLSAEIYVNLW